MPRRPVTAAVLAAVLSAVGAPVAAGQSIARTASTSVTILGGTLRYAAPLTVGDFPPVTLNGRAQVVTAAVNPFAVTDARGGSAGWHLTVRATQFTDAAGNTLPTGSMRMALPPAPSTDTQDNPLALPPTVSPTTLSPIDGAPAQKLASAAAAPLSGAGTWTFTPAAGLTLTVPAAVPPGTYTSQITTTLSTGP